MKILLTTLNSKYIHSALSLKYIYNNIADIEGISVLVKEYTINENLQDIFADIFSDTYDLIAFSCYIWNIEYIIKLCNDIKIADNNVKILLGGPEVSYESYEFMSKYDFADFIIRDEGEVIFRKFIKSYISNKNFSNIPSFLYRKDEKIIENTYEPPIENLALIKGAYDIFNKDDVKDKIVYYETSRGCSYNCAYCLSSITKKVRFFPYEKVISDIKKIVDAGAKQIKFVDRTFNFDRKRTIDIIKYLCSIDNGSINFHFEITAHILQDDLLDMLKNVRQGLFQFEIGVQSTNKLTIKSVNRVDNFDKIKEKVTKIKSFGNIHQHLDLIVGLPYEDITSLKKSFNDVMSLRPDNLQLGFLKVLKGSPIKSMTDEYSIKYRDYSPYEVISTKFITYKEIIMVKSMEEMLEDYYNSMTYNYSLDYVFDEFNGDFFDFFKRFAEFKKENSYNKNLSRDTRFLLLYEFIKTILDVEKLKIFREFLRLDFLLMGRNRNIPEFLSNNIIDTITKKAKIMDFMNREDIEVSNKNNLALEAFEIDIELYKTKKQILYSKTYVIFDYNKEKNFKNMSIHYFLKD
ncbi:radical SAM domain protein [[Eubacterium] yurii subsp. margaretiae ATCC 43715]|nr:radical SAM domain protein [[Eubacterium] yurii subsp. margaretiae ATCC 43715]